ncbi:MAG: hypothetical protein JNK74_26065 [Candidatus Hydrogenedentes bacterium]|nr:hypothetical protein [Candidatus Hydrogenedentota bacterium]
MKSQRKGSIWRTLRNFTISTIVLLILLAIGVPWGPHNLFPHHSKSMKTMAEIQNIELGITKILADSGQSRLRDFFDPPKFEARVAQLIREQSMDPFQASVEIYTSATYVLLRKGRHALDPGMADDHQSVLKTDLVEKLGNSYYPDLGLDPWGNLYQILPGPWPADMGPVVFRTYLSAYQSTPATDNLIMSGLDFETGEPNTFGFPAPADQTDYIWSFGANLISGQPIYDSSHAYTPPAQQHYEGGQEPELMGGGDDINNWDRNQTFMRFYN